MFPDCGPINVIHCNGLPVERLLYDELGGNPMQDFDPRRCAIGQILQVLEQPRRAVLAVAVTVRLRFWAAELDRPDYDRWLREIWLAAPNRQIRDRAEPSPADHFQ